MVAGVKPRSLTRTVVDLVRTRFWIAHLSRQMGYTTLEELDRDFWELKYPFEGPAGVIWPYPVSEGNEKKKEKADDAKLSSKLIYRYWRGDATPREASIHTFELVYPGSRRHLENPMWTILSEDSPSLEFLEEFFRSLPHTLKVHLYTYDESLGREIRKPLANFLDDYACVSREGHYAAMGCLIALVWEHMLKGSKNYLLNYCAEEAMNLFGRLLVSIPFYEQAKDLQHILVRTRCFSGVDSHLGRPERFNLLSTYTINEKLLERAKVIGIIGKGSADITDYLFWSSRDRGEVILKALRDCMETDASVRKEAREVLHRLEVRMQQPRIGFQHMLHVRDHI